MPASSYPVRAAVSGMRRRRGGRQRAPFEDRGPLPPRQSFVHDFVRDTLRERLMESRPAPSFSPAARAASAPGAARRAPAVFRIQPDDRERAAAGGRQPWPTAPAAPRSGAARVHAASRRRPRAPRLDFSAPPLEITPGPPPSGKLSRRLDAHGEFPAEAIPAPEISLSALSDLRPLGQIHESFIIAAGRDGLWIIDQHVAHERILFEQVMKQRAAGRVEMQRLLMPLILQLTPSSRSITPASPTNCTLPASKPSRSATAPSR